MKAKPKQKRKRKKQKNTTNRKIVVKKSKDGSKSHVKKVAGDLRNMIINVKKRFGETKFIQKISPRFAAFRSWLKLSPQKQVYLILRVVALLFGAYLVIYPFVPRIQYYLFYRAEEAYPYETGLVAKEEDEVAHKEIPTENRLVIPSIHVDMPIVEGTSDKVLDLGVWHRPGTGTPGSGNMVLTGHRVGYAFLPEDVKNSTSFYNLDKLKDGDYVIVYWSQQEYDYEITGFEIVAPDAMQVENQNVGERLTLYTCHPIGSNAKRLVYYAQRIEE